MALALGCLLGKVFGGFGGCLEGLEGFGTFGVFTGWQTVPLKAHRKLCCGLGPGVPVGEVALALGCLLGRVFGGCLEGLEGVWRVWRVLERLECFGGCLAGFWQGLKANRKPLSVCGLGKLAALKANRLPLKWPWPWGACWGRCLEGFGGFGGF